MFVETAEYVYVCIRMHVYVCIRVHVYVCIRVHVYVCIHVHVYVCIRVHVYACIQSTHTDTHMVREWQFQAIRSKTLNDSCDYLLAPPGGLWGEHEVEDKYDNWADIHWPCDVRVDVHQPGFHAVCLNNGGQAYKSGNNVETLSSFLGLQLDNGDQAYGSGYNRSVFGSTIQQQKFLEVLGLQFNNSKYQYPKLFFLNKTSPCKLDITGTQTSSQSHNYYFVKMSFIHIHHCLLPGVHLSSITQSEVMLSTGLSECKLNVYAFVVKNRVQKNIKYTCAL